MTRILQFLILIYRTAISPLLGQNCRFTPSCSCYMHEALEKHGFLKGLTLGAIRILKCNPWMNSAWSDPVPDAFAWGNLIRYNRFNAKNRQKTKKPEAMQ